MNEQESRRKLKANALIVELKGNRDVAKKKADELNEKLKSEVEKYVKEYNQLPLGINIEELESGSQKEINKPT